jgi:cell wall-associated NlpC family hydrolase
MTDLSQDVQTSDRPLRTNSGAWAGAYMRSPFRRGGRDRESCDCFGLVRLVLAEQAGIILPLNDLIDPQDGRAVSEAVDQEAAAATWLLVHAGQERTFDVVVLRAAFKGGDGRSYGGDVHMGIVTRPGYLLHTEERNGPMHVPFTHHSVRNRIRRIYRHKALA